MNKSAVQFRATEELHNKLRLEAQKRGMTVSQFCKTLAVREARQIIKERGREQ